MREITADPARIAYCGLYCGACGSYLKEKCPGCHGNTKATWCKIRTCVAGKGYDSCAQCTMYMDVNDCKLFNNFMSKLFGLIFRSDRKACIAQIKRLGLKGHAAEMARQKRQSLRRGGRKG